MIRKISEILESKRPAFSFEIFPPKTKDGIDNLFRTVEELAKLEPDYISVTYGAGGSTSRSTLEIIERIQERFDITCMHHFTLVNQTISELSSHIERMEAAGVRNVLALRGDPPKEMGTRFKKIEGGLTYCYELIDLIKSSCDDVFSIGVAGFPECHIDCDSQDEDTRYLRMKVEHGADFAVSQMFFGNESYSRYLERLREGGVAVPVIPGVLPITDYHKLLTFAEACGAYICEDVHRIFAPIAHDIEETVKEGILFSIKQCEDLLYRGAPGIHFYCLNRVEPVKTIWKELIGAPLRSSPK